MGVYIYILLYIYMYSICTYNICLKIVVIVHILHEAIEKKMQYLKFKLFSKVDIDFCGYNSMQGQFHIQIKHNVATNTVCVSVVTMRNTSKEFVKLFSDIKFV